MLENSLLKCLLAHEGSERLHGSFHPANVTDGKTQLVAEIINRELPRDNAMLVQPGVRFGRGLTRFGYSEKGILIQFKHSLSEFSITC